MSEGNKGNYTYEFPMVSATATILIVCSDKILLARRSRNAEAYPGYLSLPGGFLDAGKETVEETAVRELREEIGLDIETNRLHLFHVSSSPGTDPRAHVVNVCYWVEITDQEALTLNAADDVEEIVWMETNEYRVVKPELAFNHAKLLARGLYDMTLHLKDRFLWK